MKNILSASLAILLAVTGYLNFTLSQELADIYKASGPTLSVEDEFKPFVSAFLMDLENHRKMNPTNPTLNQRLDFISIKMVNLNTMANSLSQNAMTCANSSTGIVLSAKVSLQVWNNLNMNMRQYVVSKIISSCMKQEDLFQKDMI